MARTQNITTANAILMEMFDGMVDAIHRHSFLLDRIPKRVGKMIGEKVVVPIKARKNFGFGPRAETSAATPAYMPAPGALVYKEASFTPKHYYHGMSISGPLLSASVRNGSIVDLIKDETMDMRRHFGQMINYDLYRGGESILATPTEDAAGDTVLVVDDITQLDIGQPICIVENGGGATVEGRIIADGAQTITAKSAATGGHIAGKHAGTITVGTPVTYDKDEVHILPQGGAAAGQAEAWDNSLIGLPTAIDNTGTTYGGIDRSAEPGFYDGLVYDGSGGFDIHTLEEMQEIQVLTNDGQTDAIITHPYHYRQYGDLLYPDRRWSDKVKTFDGGYKGLEFNGAPFIKDPNCPIGTMYFLDFRHLVLDQTHEIGPVGEDNIMLRLPETGGATTEDKVVGRFRWSLQLTCRKPSCQLRVHSLPHPYSS